MSTISANYTDPKLDTVKAAVGRKSDSIPFLLLPVRMETRFMKVENPLRPIEIEQNSIETIWLLLAEGEVLLSQELVKVPKENIGDLLQEATIKLGTVNQLIKKNAANITFTQRGLINQNISQIRLLLARRQFRSFSGMTKSIRAALNQIRKQLKTDSGPRDTAYLAGSAYLQEMKSIELRLLHVRQGKIPYTRPIHKKTLYAFTQHLFRISRGLYTTAASRAKDIQLLEPGQYSRIKQVHENIKTLLPQATSILGKVHDDKNWKKFIQKIDHSVKSMAPLFTSFEKEVMPKLQFLSELDWVGADDLFYQHTRLLAQVERLRLHPNDKVVQGAERKLKKEIKRLARQNQKLIRSNAIEYAYLESIWRKLDRSISDVNQRIGGGAKLPANTQEPTPVYFQKKISFIPQLATPVYSPKLTLFENRKLEELQDFNRELVTSLTGLIKTTKAEDVDSLKLNQKLGRINTKLQSAITGGLFITQDQQQRLDQVTNLLQENVRASKLGKQEKASLQEQLETMQADLTAASIGSLKSTAKNYSFKNELDNAVILPTNLIVDELWVRIFPDDIFVQTHEQGLTEEEVKSAQDYWKVVWRVNEDQAQILSVWRMLCARFGKNRAAWIIKTMDPAKLGTRKNEQAFANKPINYLYQALPDLEWLNDNLIEPAKEGEIPHPFDNDEVIDRFEAVNQNLTEASAKAQYASLAEQARVLSRNIYSKLYSLDKTLFENTDASKSTGQADNRNQIVAAFNKQQNLLAGLKVVSITQNIHSLKVPFVFPKVGRRPASWSEVPHTKVLPDKFAVITMNGENFEHIVVGNDIPEKLPLGMDPALIEDAEEDSVYQLDENGNLIVEEGIRWMTDFEEAVNVGMGMKIPLSKEIAEQGFDRVLVLGLKESGTKKSQALLEELLQNHHYAADGLEFIKPGTASNNTEEETSDYNSVEEELDAIHAMEFGDPLFDDSITEPLDLADGKRVADALGIDAAVLQHTKHADGSEISNALLFNRCLSYATLYDYMEEMMDSLFTWDSIQRTHSFFNDAVVARGALPLFRIGNQPYGILIASAFSRYSIDGSYDENNLPPLDDTEANLQLRFDIRQKQVLSILHDNWTSIRKDAVISSERLAESEDPQQEFVEMLGLHANTAESYFRYGVNVASRNTNAGEAEFAGDYQAEDTFGPVQLYYMFQSLIDAVDSEENDKEISAENVSHFEKSRLFQCRFLDQTASILGGYIDDAFPVAETNPLPDDVGPDYIGGLLDQPNLYEILKDNTADSFPSKSLLYLLLRQAFLIAYREVALDILQHEGLVDSAFRRIIGSSDHYIRPDQKFRTKWSYLMLSFTVAEYTVAGMLEDTNFDPFFDFSIIDTDEPIDLDKVYDHLFVRYLGDKSEPWSLAQYLFLENENNLEFPSHRVYFDKIAEVRDDYSRLTALTSRELDQLLREHLDLSYYRLDAWILGLYNKRLWEKRASQSSGILLGAYAWVENLRPGGARTEIQTVPESLRAEGDIIYTDEDNQGFIHAPSMNQAIAAAVLRSGYQANSFEEDINNKFAVNVSSFRVRKALGILSGIANGLELSAILGYQFEKGLHERYRDVELDKFIIPFRNEFPLTVPISEDITTSDTADSIESNVVNALDLINKLDEEIGMLDFAQQSSLYEVLSQDSFNYCPDWLNDLVRNNGGGDTELTAIIREIDQIADAFDAIGDLVTSESVYQIVQGNHVRAAAIIQALADGKAIPEPWIVHTPRTGTLVNHRMVLCLDPDASNTADGWTQDTRRSNAAPALNYWIGKLLGAATEIKIIVQIDGAASSYSLDDLEIQPIDLLYLIHADPTNPNNNLTDMIKFKLRTTDTISFETPIDIDFEAREQSWQLGVKTIYELQPLVAQLKELITDAKPLSAEDLALPEGESESEDTKKQDLDELVARIEPIKETLLQLKFDIVDQFLANHPEKISDAQDFADARVFLLSAFYFGFPNAITNIGIEETPEDGLKLLQRLQVVGAVLTKMSASIDSILTSLTEDLEAHNQVHKWMEIAKVIFGRSFPVIPKFYFEDPNDLASQLGDDPAKVLKLNSSNSLSMDSWLQGMSRVRKKMAALEMQRIFLELDGQSVPVLIPVQLPYQIGDYWLGIDYPDDYQPTGDKLSLLTMDSQYIMGGAASSAGLILDEWTELIPHKEEVSGISFNYDQPDATPAQSLLLAVSPKLSGKWDWDNLVYTLIDTLELAKNRAVEPDHLEQSIFGQILPAIVSEVVPPEVAQDGYANPLGTQVVMDFNDNYTPPVEEANE